MLYDKPLLKQIIPDLIDSRDIKKIREIFDDYNIVDLAEIFQELKLDKAIFLYRVLPKENSGELFSYLDSSHQEKLINALTSLEVKEVIDNMFSDDIVDFIEEMPANVVNKILKSVNEKERSEINKLLSYKPQSAGSIMTTDFIELKDTYNVSEAISFIRETHIDAETINYCFVVDNYRNYLGIVYLRDIIISDNNKKIKDLLSEKLIFSYDYDDQEKVAELVREYDIGAIAIVNNQKKLLGIVTADDVLDVIVEEAEEDMQKMSGLSPSEFNYSYRDLTIKNIVRSRVKWLILLMISATFTGYILQNFEDKLKVVVALSASIPVIMSSAGNSGAQSSAMIIRAMATDKLSFKHLFYILRKEFLVSLLTGFTMGILNFFRLYLFSSNSTILISFVISATIFLAIIISDIIGAILPIIAQKFNVDPASMAAPLITTIIDAASLIIYFYLAIIILKI